ncbi:MAG: hypothetical protein CMJ64_16715 [Planctomycetaceae bacterium]|nr:hypothetical protein [Planctomycetaceae bacterium]
MPQIATKTDCPDADVLAKYVSGSLVEAHADGLFSHIESCEACQHTVDEMARRADSLVSAMRRPVVAPSAQDSQELNRLIDVVKQARPTNTPQLTSEGKIGPVPLDQFIACLSKSGLSSAEQISSWVQTHSPDSSLNFANALAWHVSIRSYTRKAILVSRR